MPKLYSSNEIIRVLLKEGFIFIGQKGSHSKYRKYGDPTLTTIVPVNRKAVPLGTFKSILRQSGLSLDKFRDMSE